MRLPLLISFLFLTALLSAQSRYLVSSGTEFNTAHQQASAGDTIVWESGVYSDIRMDIDKDGLTVTAEPYGSVLFKGVSRAVINGDNVTFSGIQYVGGFIRNLDVIRVYGSDVLITHVNIQNYTCYKYLRVYEESRRTTISYCNFENRLNLDDQNILSILVDDEPGFHRIQHCSFKNFDGIGNDQGIEPIRIGVSTQGHLDSRTLVEYCYFTKCNGDGEIISHKSRQNVYRYNTFENNPVAELVLRHGDEGIVYGNFFLNNMGGIRVREGSNHFIYNNYFEGLKRRAIYLQNDPSDPLSEIHIYHNTIIDSEEIILGSNGNNPPTNVNIANNVFTNPKDQLFVQATGNETWIANLSFGNLGIDNPATGITSIDPMLIENVEGFFQPLTNSPLIASADMGYPLVPLYPGMDYDNEISLDLMKESRPLAITDRAIGASEFSSSVNVQPHATEMNTGPSYLFENPVDYVAVNALQLFVDEEGDTQSIKISSNINWTVTSSEDWISTDLRSGSGDAKLNITIAANPDSLRRSASLTIAGGTESATIAINQDPGEGPTIEDSVIVGEFMIFPNPTDGKLIFNNISEEFYSATIELIQLNGSRAFLEEYIIRDNAVEVDLDKLAPAMYIMKVKFVTLDGTFQTELTRTLVRN
ncbi:MAG: chondroitinase-B domain-containing protein [Bacteroidia bacterium]|nr:chondroitinase-B domain-containing protein [Bacteroidia bacterium]